MIFKQVLFDDFESMLLQDLNYLNNKCKNKTCKGSLTFNLNIFKIEGKLKLIKR